MFNEFFGVYEVIEKVYGYNILFIGYECLINMVEIVFFKVEGKLDDVLVLFWEILFDFFYVELVMSVGERIVLSVMLDKVLNFLDYESM